MMKKTTILMSGLLLCGGLSAQRTTLAPTPYPLDGGPRALIKPLAEEPASGIAKAAPGDTVLYENFANGLAGNSGFGAWTTGGPDGALWLHDMDGPNGDFSSTQERIASTSVGDGFMMFDSNVFNNGCTSCTTLDGYLISPVLDLSATPNVHLQFEERFRWCCSGDGVHFVDVSTDGGTTWPTRFSVTLNADINLDVQTNEDIGTHVRRFNLVDAISADPSNVVIRIAHEGSVTGNATHYHWQVDDLLIVESPEYDTRFSYTDYDDHVAGDLTDNYPYSVYPFSQLREFNMRGRVHNEGSNIATNVTLDVDVNDGTGSVFTSSASLASMVPGAQDSITIPGFTPPMVAATYSVTYDLSADSADALPADNSATQEFMVDPYVYAMDRGARDGESDNLDNEYYRGNVFYIESAADMTGIQVAVSSGVGATIHGILLDSNLDPVEFTDIHIITSQDITPDGGANFITLPFSVPVPLTPGEEYVVVMEHFGGATNVEVATSGLSIPFVSLLYDPVNSAGPTWFYTTNTPMVRASFDPTLSVQDNTDATEQPLLQNYPNPATDITTIMYELDEITNASLQIMDLSGKVILDLDQGVRGAGIHRIELDTRTLSEGSYFYRLSTDLRQITKRMSVIH